MKDASASVAVILSSAVLVLSSGPRISSAQDLEQQHEQLVCKAIANDQPKKLKALLTTPYVTADGSCGRGGSRDTFIDVAAQLKMPSSVEILLAEGADSNAPSVHAGRPDLPLSDALDWYKWLNKLEKRGGVEYPRGYIKYWTVRALVDGGADINRDLYPSGNPDFKHRFVSALHKLVWVGCKLAGDEPPNGRIFFLSVAKLLHSTGKVNLTIKDKDGRTAVELAKYIKSCSKELIDAVAGQIGDGGWYDNPLGLKSK